MTIIKRAVKKTKKELKTVLSFLPPPPLILPKKSLKLGVL